MFYVCHFGIFTACSLLLPVYPFIYCWQVFGIDVCFATKLYNILLRLVCYSSLIRWWILSNLFLIRVLLYLQFYLSAMCDMACLIPRHVCDCCKILWAVLTALYEQLHAHTSDSKQDLDSIIMWCHIVWDCRCYYLYY